MKNLKEKTIPMTKDDFVCYGLMAIVGLGAIHITLIATGVLIWNDFHLTLSAFSFVSVVLGGIFGAIFWTDRWDLNPIHAIGYCLRWKRK